jgi:hypothetical protein
MHSLPPTGSSLRRKPAPFGKGGNLSRSTRTEERGGFFISALKDPGRGISAIFDVLGFASIVRKMPTVAEALGCLNYKGSKK